jgi:sporulation-control protein
MGFFSKVLASVGIGSARVNTVLYNSNVYQGGEIRGHIDVEGGSSEQRIDKINLFVMTRYEKESGDHKVKLNDKVQWVDIPILKDIKPGEKIQIPFAFTLDKNTPISSFNCPVWIHTGLDIKGAVDPGDTDKIQVGPHPYLEVVINAVENLGFTIRDIRNEYSRMQRRFPFVQEIEFRPHSYYGSRLQELEVIYFIHDDSIELIVEIDRRARGLGGFLAEALDLDESKVRLRLGQQELRQGPAYVSNAIRSLIDRYI